MSAIQTHFSKALIFALAGALMAHGATLSGTVSGGKGVAVVYIDTIPGKTFPAPDKHIVEDQKSLLFQPHVIVVLAGSTVDFLNSDTVQHNAPGIVPLLCNVHPEMSGYIVVVPTPYSAEADASGAFKMENVPDGSYTVTAWREGMKAQSKPVTISGTATADFTLTK